MNLLAKPVSTSSNLCGLATASVSCHNHNLVVSDCLHNPVPVLPNGQALSVTLHLKELLKLQKRRKANKNTANSLLMTKQVLGCQLKQVENLPGATALNGSVVEHFTFCT